jgi:hypothetical protein
VVTYHGHDGSFYVEEYPAVEVASARRAAPVAAEGTAMQ